MKRISNDKLIIDDKEIKTITKNSYNKGVVFGCATTAGVVKKHLSKLTSENIEEIKNELNKFCDNLISVQVKGGK